MPRYFFDLRNGVDVADEEGRILPDLASARTAAIAEAREMMTAAVLRGELNLGHSIEVRDESGATVLVMRFGEAVEVTPMIESR